ncbi:MAG: 2,3-bisphosphoglycerate-independent phosphoglycerate mutase [Berkelbacteria bacterium GW2011_GWB1_38_5]|uniref:2,3-bisphosphoglycerate-independent phosphoglycerate mutase n=2 Tax=Candidatus Berkelbacteria TaxID=1618330 RepID=A0A0G0LG30_9BACT|nr:MAG: 2,3-bisphosphoglycerate-independent phosphoglycerate mutase [Berkelbacteria bacterium GW2011_GWB1_38_5]KKQ90828.1 MAG: 2,3-bisphosphoglycerate-independent phosphoglycerate mutase [Berkelbacteria bacterium GW2011_GWA1_39_10]
MNIQKVNLIILDGWGNAPAWGGNAVEMAQTPNFDDYWRKYPHTLLKAAEEAVGLPSHEPGNSEVGHLNLGSGLIVRQNLPGITALINDGSFLKNKVLIESISHAKENQSNIHIMGLLSDGGVHSHINHLFALLDLIKKQDYDKVFIHIFTDGRDTDPMKALLYISDLEDKIKNIDFGRIESVSGRYYAMDRDNRWDRIQKSYECIVLGKGVQAESVEKAVSAAYRQGQTDEFIVPTVINNTDENFVPVSDNDTVIFFNFRADRTRELIWAFTKQDFKNFHRSKSLNNLYFASFSFHEEYEEKLPIKAVFRPADGLHPIGKVCSENSLKQLHIAETEKYAHVTYFFNGGQESPFSGEERQMIPSPKIASYDLKPEMSAPEITQKLISRVNDFEFTVVNFANADMVGHTGNMKAAVRACETVDKCLGLVIKENLSKNIISIITADHGNAEQMINPDTSEPDTEHTTNPVPFILISSDPKWQNPLKVTGEKPPALSDVAPTILKIMGLEIPKEMTGQSLIG